MAPRGPKPRPTFLKVIAGTARRCRSLNSRSRRFPLNFAMMRNASGAVWRLTCIELAL